MVESTTSTDLAASLGLDRPYPVTSEHIRSLYEDGWTRLPGLLSPDAVDWLREQLQGAAFQSGPAATDANYLPGRQPAARSQHGPAWVIPDVSVVGSSPRLGDVAVRLMGVPEALFVHDITFFKAPGGTGFGQGPTMYHQDLPFLPYDRKGSITIWIALVDMTEEMGPLQYVEGSHREGPLGRGLNHDMREEYPHLYNSPVVGGGVLKAGDAQAHWDLTLHGTKANSSDRIREAYAVRYTRTDTIYIGTGHAHFDEYHPEVGHLFAECDAFPRVGLLDV